MHNGNALCFAVDIEIVSVFSENNEEIHRSQWSAYGLHENNIRRKNQNANYNKKVRRNSYCQQSAARDSQQLCLLTEVQKIFDGLQQKQSDLEQKYLNEMAMSKQYISELNGTIQRLCNDMHFMKNAIKAMEYQKCNSNQVAQRKQCIDPHIKRCGYNRANEELVEWFTNSCELPQYITVFVENGYDSMSIVKEMSCTELKDIGITLKGHQFKILKEIKKLHKASTVPSVPSSVPCHRRDAANISDLARDVHFDDSSDVTVEHRNSRSYHLPSRDLEVETVTNHKSYTSKSKDIKTEGKRNEFDSSSPGHSTANSIDSNMTHTTTDTTGYFSGHCKRPLFIEQSVSDNYAQQKMRKKYKSSLKELEFFKQNYFVTHIESKWKCEVCNKNNIGMEERCEFCDSPKE